MKKPKTISFIYLCVPLGRHCKGTAIFGIVNTSQQINVKITLISWFMSKRIDEYQMSACLYQVLCLRTFHGKDDENDNSNAWFNKRC